MVQRTSGPEVRCSRVEPDGPSVDDSSRNRKAIRCERVVWTHERVVWTHERVVWTHERVVWTHEGVDGHMDVWCVDVSSAAGWTVAGHRLDVHQPQRLTAATNPAPSDQAQGTSTVGQ